MINIKMQPTEVNKLSPKIAVVGVGGAGGNAVNNMIASNLEGCEFVVCNTDAQALQNSMANLKVQLGVNVTGGLGAGSKPEVGQAAAEETIDDIMHGLEGANMVFITAGMGGGTGTGAAPVIAKACRQHGILTVGVVTKPFHFEGAHRMDQAERGIREMQQYVDTLIVIPNQNLFRIANEKTTFAEAFKMADGVLQAGVRGVTDLIVRNSYVNLDFADIRTGMQQMGKAVMGTGEASGDKRAIEAAEAAINNPLLDEVSMKGAQGVIINVTGGYDMTLFEADEAANRIRDEVDPNANIIFGATFDEKMDGKMRVSIIATGIDREVSRAKVQTTTTSTGSSSSGNGNGGGTRAPLVQTRQELQQAVAAERQAAQVMPEPPARSAINAISGREAVRGLTAPAPIERAAPPQKQHVPTREEKAETSLDMFEQEEFAIAGLGEPIVPQNTVLRGTTYKDSFIPPKPMEPDMVVPTSGVGSHIGNYHGIHANPREERQISQPVSQQPATETTNSVAAAPRLTAPRPQQPQKRAPSLFERITGSVQQQLDNFRDDSALIQPKAPQPEPVQKIAVGAPSQGPMNITVPAGKPTIKIDDELDIPAFLRRQAN